MNVAEIEAAVERLPIEEYQRFERWFEEYAQRRWDRQIEADAEAGKLDALVAEVDAVIAAGRSTAL